MNTSLSSPVENAGGAFTVAAFCQRHGISRAKFYQLLSTGEGPRIFKIGRRTLISTEAALAWRQSMEERTAARQEFTQ